jgi:aminopeptidase N
LKETFVIPAFEVMTRKLYFGLILVLSLFMKHLFFIIIAFICYSINAQQTEFVDFKTIKATLNPKLEDKGIGGQVEITFKILKDVDAISLDANNFEQIDYKLDDEALTHAYNGKQLIIKHPFKKGDSHSLFIEYYTKPQKAIYFVDNQIWTQGQGKYTSNWLPSIDDTNDKIVFDLTITYKNDYQVLANGKLLNKEVGKETTIWHYNMQKPMPSYLVALAIGKYSKKELTSKRGIPIELYYYPEDSAKVEPTYRYTKQMFDFLENEIGVNYPWQNYKQVPVKDFLYSGMENTSLTIFSDDFMIDETSFVDKNYVNVNAHELAHQWFGDLVTATKGEHHWLQEGFATYYALLAERDIFGDDYYYWRLYEYAHELIAQEQAGNSTALLDAKSSSTTFYKKGAWALHILKEEVGEKAFKKAVKKYLKKYKFKNVETLDFIREVEQASGVDLNGFVSSWLTATELPLVAMKTALEKNETSAFLVTMEDTPYLSYRTDENGYISSSIVYTLPNGFHAVKTAVLKEALNKPEYPGNQSILEDAFKSKELKVRQVLAENMPVITPELKTDNETLLSDASYLTIEAALFNLVNNFPEDAKKYLEQTKTITGFNNKNVRLLWLVLAITSDVYSEAESEDFINELIGYTNAEYNFEVRMSAFQYLRYISSCEAECIKNLEQATTHHNWRMVKFAKETLNQLKR